MKKHLLAAGLRGVGHGHMTVHRSFVKAAAADAMSQHAAAAAETSAATSDKTQAQQEVSPAGLPLQKQSHE